MQDQRYPVLHPHEALQLLRGNINTPMQDQVFISYRHESPDHARAVRRLGELLRQAQIPVALDQFFLDEHPGGPDLGGWSKWCEDCANESACVLLIASHGWFMAYDKAPQAEARMGFGAATEADLFRQGLWDDKGNNVRIRLVFLHDVALEAVPVRLRAWHQFRPFDSNDQLEQLIRWVGGCLGLQGIQAPTVRWPEPVLFQPDIANRNEKEWPAIVDLLSGRSCERIVLIGGGEGAGKSELVRQAKKYAEEKLGMAVSFVDFKGGSLDVVGVLEQIDLDMGTQLPNFSRERDKKTHLLRKDLRTLRQPVLLIFDHYEDAGDNKTVVNWLSQQLLVEIETSLCLSVIIAGRKVPEAAGGWRQLTRSVQLGPIEAPEDWEPWIARRYPAFKDKGHHLPTLLRLAKGNPLQMANFCVILAGNSS